MHPKMQRMHYTDEQRTEALKLLAEVGKAAAARRTGIPAGTIASWGVRHGVHAPPPEAMAKQAEARTVSIVERKVKLAEDLAVAAERMLGDLYGPRLERKVVTFAALGETRIVDVRHKTTTATERKTTIEAVSKALETVQLLTGEATERIEQIGGGSHVDAAKAVLADVRERHLKAVG